MKTFHSLLVTLFLMACTTVAGAQTATDTVTWITFQEAVEKSKTSKKPIFIDVYTDWCGWCKVMDKKTFDNPQVAKLLNEKFYAVKFNAEQREDVVFNGHTFRFVSQGRGGYHELAAALLNNKLSFPTVVFLNEDFAMLQPVAGYQEPKNFHPIAEFFGSGQYKSTSWAEFQKQYQSPF